MPTAFNNVQFFNGTPHTINYKQPATPVTDPAVKPDSYRELAVFPSDTPGGVRVVENPPVMREVDGIIYSNESSYSDQITGLPEDVSMYTENDVLVVSWAAASALMSMNPDERRQQWPGKIVSPNMANNAWGAVRDDEGRICGTCSFVWYNQ